MAHIIDKIFETDDEDVAYNEETKQKIGLANSIAVKGKTLSEEHKENIRKGKEGLDLSHTAESKAKISEKLKGKPKSEEHKAKLKTARAKQIITEETKQKMRNSQLTRWQKKQNSTSNKDNQ